jgi:4-hydroxy-4-methyl-2-oxoglutarate aldolase
VSARTDLGELGRRLASLDTACLCDADRTIRVLDPAIRPLGEAPKLIGTAFTVSCSADFLQVLKGLRDAQAGDVLVVDAGGGRRAVAGELFATEAARKGLAGMVVDGAVRDSASIRGIGLPVYARHVHPLAGGSARVASCQLPVRCGGVLVHPGDVVFGDGDGVVVASRQELERILPAAEAVQAAEATVLERMASGESLFQHLNFERHYQRISDGEASDLRLLP